MFNIDDELNIFTDYDEIKAPFNYSIISLII